jgi:hypothetical protein
MPQNIATNGLLNVANTAESSSNEGTHGNSSDSSVPTLLSQLPNQQIMININNGLKKLNQGTLELNKEVRSLKHLVLSVIVSLSIGIKQTFIFWILDYIYYLLVL